MKKIQVRFTTKTMMYYKNVETYDEAKSIAYDLVNMGVYNEEEILHVGIISPQYGLKVIK